MVNPAPSHFFGRQHYVDAGNGDPIIMLHGNPTWHYYFRNLTNQLRGRYRCIVPDHIGCGYSEKPPLSHYDYSLHSRINDIEALLDHLNIKDNITLIVHDWGGMIGLGYAARFPERIRRIIAMNTSCARLPAGKRFPWSLWLGRNTKLGEWLILKQNLFCRLAARWCVTRKPLPPEVREMYLKPYDSPENRIAVLKFVQTIPLSSKDEGWEIVVQVEERLAKFRHLPTLLLWGMKDFVFDHHFLKDWQRNFPQAETLTWQDCGHYLLEDAGDEVLRAIDQWLEKNPVGSL